MTALEPIRDPRLTLHVLSPNDIARIHEATLEIIATVGVRFPSERALDIWAAAGAEVDRATQIVRAPAPLIERALAVAPPTYDLAGRDPALDLTLDGRHVHVGTDGCGIEIIDRGTGQLRRSTLADVVEIARVADALPEVAFHWVPVSAQDMPPATRSLHELAATWRNSTKHVQTESVVTAREAEAAVEMASAICGGREALRRRPILSIMQCTISPLAHEGGALDAALVAAEAGVPTGFMTMASCAFTGPATPAGTLVVGNAEVVSALALIELAAPGAPVFYAAAQTAIDLRSGAYTGGGPEDFLFGAATNQLADFYDVPLSMGAFATGAKVPDWQAGVENALSTFMASAVCSDMLLGVGLLNGSRYFSFEQLIRDCEIVRIVRSMLRGIVVDDESLGLDAIRAAGPNGDFLTAPHTRRHMRELWQSRLLDRRPYGAWHDDPDWSAREARERANQILATHQPTPLDDQLSAELERIIGSAEAAAGSAEAAAGGAHAAEGGIRPARSGVAGG